MFQTDPKLFLAAYNNANCAKEIINECIRLINESVITGDQNYTNCKNNLEQCGINDLIDKIEMTKKSLFELDQSFANEYMALIQEIMQSGQLDTTQMNQEEYAIKMDSYVRDFNYNLLYILEKYEKENKLTPELENQLKTQRTIIKKYELQDELDTISEFSDEYIEKFKTISEQDIQLIRLDSELSEKDKELKIKAYNENFESQLSILQLNKQIKQKEQELSKLKKDTNEYLKKENEIHKLKINYYESKNNKTDQEYEAIEVLKKQHKLNDLYIEKNHKQNNFIPFDGYKLDDDIIKLKQELGISSQQENDYLNMNIFQKAYANAKAYISSGFESIINNKYQNMNETDVGTLITTSCESYLLQMDFSISSEDKIQQLNKVKDLAEHDSQIDTSGKLANLTDFQNVMLSDLCLIELLYEDDEAHIAGKTFGELYLESINEINDTEYDQVYFDVNEMMNMADLKNRAKYRNLVLGKFVRYGFADIKINEKIRGEDGFDAFILEDVDGNLMVHYTCTNLIEHEDFLYDAYPILSNINKVTNTIGDTLSLKVYNSQQEQAKKLLEEVIKTKAPQVKVNVSGFSLGGSLAECAYLNSYGNNKEELANLVLYNPYHNILSKEEVDILKDNKKYKLYVCEGDSASSVFNYEDLKNKSKPIYIDYEENIQTTNDAIDINNGIANRVATGFKNEYLDYLIDKCKTDNVIGEKIIVEQLENLKNKEIPLSETLHFVTDIIRKIPGASSLEESTNFGKLLLNVNYIESIFTSTHLPYTVDSKKNVSFDEYGNVRKTVEIDGQTHQVEYPSFTEVNEEKLGTIFNVLNIKEK